MTQPPDLADRLRFLLETVALEAQHLCDTDRRLFAEPFTAERAGRLKTDALLSERADAHGLRGGVSGVRRRPETGLNGLRSIGRCLLNSAAS